MPVDVSRAAVRAARSAAALPLDMIAAAAGTSTSGASRRLRALKGRGVCAQAAALAASRRPVWCRRVVLSHWACPPSVRRVAGGDRSAVVRAAAADPVAAAGRARATAGRVRAHGETIEAMKDPGCPPAVLRALVPDDPNVGSRDRERFEVALHAVSHPAAPLDLLARAAEYSGLRYAAAQHRSCPPQVLLELVRRSRSTRRAAAANPACSPEMLAELALDPDLRTRSAAISNPSLPAVALAAVCDPAADIDDAVLAASNPNSGPGLARRLAASDDDAVAVAAASVRACPTDVLESLAARSELLGAVAAHAACPVDLLVSAAGQPLVADRESRRRQSEVPAGGFAGRGPQRERQLPQSRCRQLELPG